MKTRFNTLCHLGAALLIAGAGILQLIDQTTMIVLAVVLTCCMPNGTACVRANGA